MHTFLHTNIQNGNEQTSSSCVLYEGRHIAPEITGQTHVPHQLCGDGQSHRCAPHLPPVQGPADQGRLSAAQEGVSEWCMCLNGLEVCPLTCL